MELPHSYYRGKKHVPIPSGKRKISVIIKKNKKKQNKTKIYKEKSLMFVKGRFVVGCTDVMIGGAKEDDGCFLRIFYPTKLTDTYVGTH